MKSEWRVSSKGGIFEVYREVEGRRSYMPWLFSSYKKAEAVANHMNEKELDSCELTNSSDE